jgi:hypothetical protein
VKGRLNIVGSPQNVVPRGLVLTRLIIVQDLASRFADGRLSTDKLLKATDDELAEMLIEVKGIGRVSRVSEALRLRANVSPA